MEIIIILLSLAAGGLLGRFAKGSKSKGTRPAPAGLDIKATHSEPPEGMIKLVRIDPTGDKKYRPVLCPVEDVRTWTGVSAAIETCYPGCGQFVVFSRDNNEIPGFFWGSLFKDVTKKSRVFWIEYGPSGLKSMQGNGMVQTGRYHKLFGKNATAAAAGKPQAYYYQDQCYQG